MVSKEALLCVQLCAYARNSEAVRHIHLTDKNFAYDWFEDKETSTEGYVASDSDTIYIIFKSTDGLRDWLTDLSAWYKFNKTLNASVHHGFYVSLLSVEDQLASLLLKHKSLDKRLVIAGHSLGGALATISSANLIPDALYTYGSPRCMSVEAAQAFNDLYLNVERYVIAGDMFTRMPKPVFYRHVGRLFYFNLKGKLKENISLLQRAKETVIDIFDEIISFSLFKFEDHDVSLYIKYLKENNKNGHRSEEGR